MNWLGTIWGQLFYPHTSKIRCFSQISIVLPLPNASVSRCLTAIESYWCFASVFVPLQSWLRVPTNTYPVMLSAQVFYILVFFWLHCDMEHVFKQNTQLKQIKSANAKQHKRQETRKTACAGHWKCTSDVAPYRDEEYLLDWKHSTLRMEVLLDKGTTCLTVGKGSTAFCRTPENILNFIETISFHKSNNFFCETHLKLNSRYVLWNTVYDAGLNAASPTNSA